MVSLLYEFVYVFSELNSVQKKLDKKYIWVVSLLYVLSELNSVQKNLSTTE
jgi:hypothetical protein